jgi:hypothetical protein
MAALQGTAARAVHEDSESILMLDRDPLEWEGKSQRGIGWIQGDIWRPSPGIGDWRAAARNGACGLVLDGRWRFLHSAVNGLAPIYWIEDRGATYFASRIDPLVGSSPSRLSVDWDAWAAIIALRYPLGDRTPFAEIRRLGPFSTLRRRLGRGRARSPAWPWAEIEPVKSLGAAADATVEALRDSLDPLPEGIVCPLSGGRDSRMLFCALAARGAVATAVTVPDDEGESIEEDLAAPVASAFGVPHERLGASAATYPEDWAERARRVEFQFADHAWLVPAARRVEGAGAPVPDGFALDTFVQSERHFNPPGALDHRDGRAATLALFDALRRYGRAPLALAESFRSPIEARARASFLAATEEFRGHPSQNLLSIYATRSVRGVAAYPTGLFGLGAEVIVPGAGDRTVAAMLSAASGEKAGGRFYREIYQRLAPKIARLPSTGDTPRTGPYLPRRWRSAAAVRAHRDSLADGPLAPHLSPELRAWLTRAEEVDPTPDLRLGIESVSMFHAWWRRYRDRLQEVDPADLVG